MLSQSFCFLGRGGCPAAVAFAFLPPSRSLAGRCAMSMGPGWSVVFVSRTLDFLLGAFGPPGPFLGVAAEMLPAAFHVFLSVAVIFFGSRRLLQVFLSC